MLSFQPWHACFFYMFVQGIPKIRHGNPGRQAHRNSFRWGPLYIDIGLEQLEAMWTREGGEWDGMLGGLYGFIWDEWIFLKKSWVRNNAYKWILKHHAFDFWEQIVDILKATMWLQMVLLILGHDIITEISPDNILGMCHLSIYDHLLASSVFTRVSYFWLIPR